MPDQQVIRDVCAICNNGPLSRLDEYARKLYISYFTKEYKIARMLRLRYDYELLSKWLLKIAYNSARASSAPDIDILKMFAPYIINDNCIPINIIISVGLLGNFITFNKNTGTRKVIEIRWNRSGILKLTPSQSVSYSARMVSMNSWAFNIVVPLDVSNTWFSHDDVKWALPGRLLSTDSRSIRPPTIRTDPEGILHHYRDKFHLYDEAAQKLRR